MSTWGTLRTVRPQDTVAHVISTDVFLCGGVRAALCGERSDTWLLAPALHHRLNPCRTCQTIEAAIRTTLSKETQ